MGTALALQVEGLDDLSLSSGNELTTTTLFYSRYVDLQPVGMGAFGLVCSAKDELTGTSAAIKKM